MIRHRLRSLAALVIALLGLSLVAAPSAMAQELQASLIDFSHPVSLSVEKSAGDPLTHFGDPTNPDANLSRDPIAGVTFSARKINDVDLSTNEGWKELQSRNISHFVPGGEYEGSLGEPIHATTGADGIATFSNIEIGAYYVTEDQRSAQAQNLSVITPFVVTVPSTNQSRDQWVYDVKVTAKDQPLKTTKMANRTCVSEGDVVRVGLTATTYAPKDGRIERLEIADPLDKSLAYKAGGDVVMIADENGVVETSTLEDGDYTITAGDDNVLLLKLTEPGLAKLAAARRGNPGVGVTWKFDVTYNGSEGLPVKNKGYSLHESYPDFDPVTRPGVPSNEIRLLPCEPKTPPTTTPPTPWRPTPPTPSVPDIIPVPVPDPNLVPPETPAPQQPPAPQRLVDTGANVLGIVGVAALLIAAGLVLGRRRKNS